MFLVMVMEFIFASHADGCSRHSVSDLHSMKHENMLIDLPVAVIIHIP